MFQFESFVLAILPKVYDGYDYNYFDLCFWNGYVGLLLEDNRDTELMLLISELVDYGTEVFNNEQDKFQRWLKKPKLSLDGNSPDGLLDTVTGINEVKFCLNRLEYGNLA